MALIMPVGQIGAECPDGAGSHVLSSSTRLEARLLLSDPMVFFGRAARRRGLALHSRFAVINTLRIVWVLVVLWGELGTFFWSVAWCRWPKEVGSTPFRVLLVADPQVPRPYKGWTPTLTWLKQHIVNHNLRKSWTAARTLRPQAVIFLGDMLRHGSTIKGMPEYVCLLFVTDLLLILMTHGRYGDYFAQFQSIFKLDPAVSTYFIPGNRDVGSESYYIVPKSIADIQAAWVRLAPSRPMLATALRLTLVQLIK